MLEWAASGILGSIFGGLFRLAPEVLKFFDRKNERLHELQMFKLQTETERMRGEFRVEEKYVDFSVAQMDAIGKAMEQQGKADSKAYKWVASLSALVRPMITYVLFGMYVCFKIIMISYAMSTGVPLSAAVSTLWTPDDFAMLNMVLTFWFLSRTIEKYNKG